MTLSFSSRHSVFCFAITGQHLIENIIYSIPTLFGPLNNDAHILHLCLGRKRVRPLWMMSMCTQATVVRFPCRFQRDTGSHCCQKPIKNRGTGLLGLMWSIMFHLLWWKPFKPCWIDVTWNVGHSVWCFIGKQIKHSNEKFFSVGRQKADSRTVRQTQNESSVSMLLNKNSELSARPSTGVRRKSTRWLYRPR